MTRDLPLTTDLGDGIVQIRLPMTGNPLRYVNAYLVDDADGTTTLIDCGWKAADVETALRDALAELGRTLADVDRVVVTHFHMDHYGLAGTLRRAGVVALFMHRIDWELAEAHLADRVRFDRDADAFIARNGFTAADDDDDDDPQHHRFDLERPTRVLEDGDTIGRLRVLWTPGHSPGHICLIDDVTGRFFSGDHILDPITPHVGVWTAERGDPLGQYVASLRKAKATGAASVLPAHGEPFEGLAARVDALLAHHDEREAAVLALVDRGPIDAGSAARALPWTRREKAFAALEPAHQQFAVAETLAHLEHLRARGVVVRDDDGEIVRFRRVG
jgi:glyoxylase-like metal-dependent hydrolase (beta-lactamase superfamily II)